jgi:hypothetical protein
MTERSPSPADERAARLAEQLRANLHRRKAQARAIAAGQADKSDLPKSGPNG